MIVIKGAGDLASGAAVRLAHCGFPIVMTDLLYPTSIRRTVCFSEAILNGTLPPNLHLISDRFQRSMRTTISPCLSIRKQNA